MMFDWFPQSWWTLGPPVNCTNEEMAQLLERSFTLRRHPTQDNANETTDAGIVSSPTEFYIDGSTSI